MWADTLFPKVLNMSLTAGIVILFVLLARLLLKNAPKIFSYALWAIVLFRLICPVSFSSDFSLLGLFHTPAAVTGNGAYSSIVYIPADHMPTDRIPSDRTSTDRISTDGASANGTPANNIPAEASQGASQAGLPASGGSKNGSGSIPKDGGRLVIGPFEFPIPAAAAPATTISAAAMPAAARLWLLGIAAMLLYSAISLLRLRKKLIGAVRLRDNIYMADHINSPFVLGMLRPKIYLPSSLREQEQAYIILHEQTHIRRFDHIFKMLAFLALAVHWFNPLVWVAFLCCVKDMEMSCDERVLKEMGDGIKGAYSASLLSLATDRRLISGSLLAFGEGNLKGRIKNVLNYKRPSFWILASAVVVIVAAALTLLANPTVVTDATFLDDSNPDGELLTDPTTATDPSSATDPAAMTDPTAAATGTLLSSAKGTGPFVGYVKDAATDTFDVYTVKDGTYLLSLPWSLFDQFPGYDRTASSWTPGWMKVDIYCGSIDDFTWAVVCTAPHMGTGDANVCTSADGGKTWWVGDKNAMYTGTVTGAGFSSPEVGFMSYRYFYDRGPEISRTTDGGKTWTRMTNMTIELPEYLKEYYMTPLVPTFTVDSGIYPIELYDSNGTTSMAYLTTRDGGMTWDFAGNNGAVSEELIARADVTQDGQDEFIYLDRSQLETVSSITLRVKDTGGNELWSEELNTAHAGWDQLFLTELDGKQYLLRYNPSMFQGNAAYVYTLFSPVADGKEKVLQTKTLEFDINGTKELDAHGMLEFADEVNALLEKSRLLISSNNGVWSFGLSSAEPFFERYSLLDEIPELYRDSDSPEAKLNKYSDYMLFNRKLSDFLNTEEATELPATDAAWSPDTSIGSDMVYLDYADDSKVIFHGYFGLFIYDLKSQRLIRSLDLKAIGCDATQGDNYCEVSVNRYGFAVQLHPLSSDVLYVYTVPYKSLFELPYKDGLFGEHRFSTAGIEAAVSDPNGSYSSQAVDFGNGEYGYLYSEDWILGTLSYVRRNRVYQLFGE